MGQQEQKLPCRRDLRMWQKQCWDQWRRQGRLEIVMMSERCLEAWIRTLKVLARESMIGFTLLNILSACWLETTLEAGRKACEDLISGLWKREQAVLNQSCCRRVWEVFWSKTCWWMGVQTAAIGAWQKRQDGRIRSLVFDGNFEMSFRHERGDA